jgi:hypothetical protein
MPGTSPIGTPVAANFLGVMFDMDFLFFDTVEFTNGGALRPIASKVSHQELIAIIFVYP